MMLKLEDFDREDLVLILKTEDVLLVTEND
jgi:hypothetical protein